MDKSDARENFKIEENPFNFVLDDYNPQPEELIPNKLLKIEIPKVKRIKTEQQLKDSYMKTIRHVYLSEKIIMEKLEKIVENLLKGKTVRKEMIKSFGQLLINQISQHIWTKQPLCLNLEPYIEYFSLKHGIIPKSDQIKEIAIKDCKFKTFNNSKMLQSYLSYEDVPYFQIPPPQDPYEYRKTLTPEEIKKCQEMFLKGNNSYETYLEERYFNEMENYSEGAEIEELNLKYPEDQEYEVEQVYENQAYA